MKIAERLIIEKNRPLTRCPSAKKKKKNGSRKSQIVAQLVIRNTYSGSAYELGSEPHSAVYFKASRQWLTPS